MIPKELRARRLELGLSVADVAERVGVTTTIVSAWERGEIPIDAATKEALLNAPAAIRRLLRVGPEGNA
jgi:transcriptional regulator with XRE-family HTH domain